MNEANQRISGGTSFGSSLFQNDAFLAAQQDERTPVIPRGVHHLMLVMLVLAVEDAERPRPTGHTPNHRQIAREWDAHRASARAWFLADDVTWPFSFRRLAEVLGLVPERVIEVLQARWARCDANTGPRPGRHSTMRHRSHV